MIRWLQNNKGNDHHLDFPTMGEVDYQDIISELEQKIMAKWYLEIGSRSGASLSHRKCNFIAVDPNFNITAKVFNSSKMMIFCQQESDDFFRSNFLNKINVKPDLAFIDGMHLFEYALRDFINLERNMSRDGIICLHDVCPYNYEMTTRDLSYLSTGKPWTGDVWKAIILLLEERPDLDIKIVDAKKTGIAVIRNLDPTNAELEKKLDKLISKYQEIELKSYTARDYFSKFTLEDGKKFIANLNHG